MVLCHLNNKPLIKTSDEIVYHGIYVSPGLSELIFLFQQPPQQPTIIEQSWSYHDPTALADSGQFMLFWFWFEYSGTSEIDHPVIWSL